MRARLLLAFRRRKYATRRIMCTVHTSVRKHDYDDVEFPNKKPPLTLGMQRVYVFENCAHFML